MSLAIASAQRPGRQLRHLAEASTDPDDALAAALLTLAEAERTRSGFAAASVIAERASALLTRPGPSLDALAGAVEDAALSGDVDRVRTLVDRIDVEPIEVSPQAHAAAGTPDGRWVCSGSDPRPAPGFRHR